MTTLHGYTDDLDHGGVIETWSVDVPPLHGEHAPRRLLEELHRERYGSTPNRVTWHWER